MDRESRSVLNPSPQRMRGPGLLHDLVHSSSDQNALEHLEKGTVSSFSYAQLHTASNDIARKLLAAKPPGRDRFIVPVLHPQSPALYAALLGILKAGGAFCPLNLDVPPERLDFILKDVSATVVIVSSTLQQNYKFPDHVHTISIGTLEISLASESAPPRAAVQPSDLAYVMYTSGSTGVPKGVAISHDAATQALMAHESHVPHFSRFFQFAAPTFDVSVFEIFFPLTRGKTLVSASRSETLENLTTVLSKMEVDACELTPTVAAGLLRNRGSVPKLQTLLTIGEMLNRPVVDEFGGLADKPSMLWAMYGPTEATIHCTLMPAFHSDSPVGIIGVPLQTVSCYILDPEKPMMEGNNLNVLPKGQVGELAVGGFQLADGYLNRPEQTEKAFIETSSGRVYRTGDKARLNHDGFLECFGRISDGQVKLRGQRIELGEIEQAMLKTPNCHVATALVIDSMLVGFCAADASVSQEQIISSCSRWLPKYMVPSEIIVLQDLPKLPSGKVDREALKLLLKQRDDESEKLEKSSSRRDTSHNEDKIIQVVADCLAVDASPKSNLRSLGIDSLRAIKLAAALRDSSIDIGVADILRARTVSDLIVQSAASSSAKPHKAIPSFLPLLDEIVLNNPALEPLKSDIMDILPCTSLQSAMLTAGSYDPAAYHNEMDFEVVEQVSVPSLYEALRHICNVNEIFRTRFISWQGQPVAVLFGSYLNGTVQIATQEDIANTLAQSLSWFEPLRIRITPASKHQPTRMVIAAHHAVYDGWSMDAILHDLGKLLQGQSVSPRPQFHQLVRYHAAFEIGDHDLHKRFWADHLANWKRKPFPVLVESPGSGGPQAVTHHFEVDRASINEASQRIGCGTSSLILAALSLAWKGILGSDDFVVGNTTSGRALPIPRIDEIIGPCIATLPLRVQFQQIETSDQLVKYIDSMSANLIEHSELPLSEIRKLAGLRAFEGLYDVLFTFQESLYSQSVRGGPFKQTKHLDRLETKVLVEVEPTTTGFSLQATYHADVMDAGMATQLLQQISICFRDIIIPAGQSLPAVFSTDSLPPALHNFPIEETSEIPDLAAAFEKAAVQHADLPALDFMSTSADGITSDVLTFSDLNARANAVAHLLQSRGAHPGMVIGIIMEKSVSLYVCILAILKSGCAYLPLLPTTPPVRVRDIMSQASVSLCVVDRLDGRATSETPSTTKILPLQKECEAFPKTNLCIEPNEGRLAYVIFTSGTTGIPKGVSVTQRNITSNIEYLRNVYPINTAEQRRLLQACSQAFDVSVFEIFFTWLSGMCLCSGTNDTLFADLEQSIRTLEITHLSLTPTVAAMIDPDHVPSVQFLVTAGEPLTRTVLNKWGSLLWQGYGPSETTNICSVKRMNKRYNIEHLGHAFSNTSTIVLQPHGQAALPFGWVGELCFGGQQVAHGYMGDEALTSAKFIDHGRYGRLYRSGDLGRMLPDGTLVILGRIDTQVKLRGQRIETAEIDHVFSMHQGLHSAVTLLMDYKADSSTQCLVAFLTFTSPPSTEDLTAMSVDLTTHHSLFATLQAHLPSYMIPTYLIPISRIPQTASGKCDSKKLREFFRNLPRDYLSLCAQSQHDGGEDADWHPDEEIIRATVANSLGIAETEIGRWTSLIGIGLDSISAIRVAGDLSAALNTRVPISTLLLNPCVSLLAKHLKDGKQVQASSEPMLPKELTDSVVSRIRGQPLHIAKVLPCTPLQEGMLSQGRGTYYNRVLLRLRSSAARIQDCWEEVCRRHEILRTCFMSTKDRKTPIVQAVLDGWTVPWHTYSVNELSLVGVVERHMATLPEPVDSNIPPLSLALITYRGSHFISFLCHHALYDGTAINILWREIEALARGEPLLPPISYEPFLRAMRYMPEDLSDFWGEQLRDRKNRLVFASQGPTSTAQQAIYTARFEHRLDETQNYLQSRQIGLLSLCQAAWSTVLSMLTGSRDVIFGNVTSGRNLDVPGIAELVAPCFNTIPIRHILDDSQQNFQVLQQLQKLNQTLIPYQFSPLREILRSAGASRLFDTVLLVQQPLQEMDETIWTLEEDVGEMDVPLVCEVTPCPNLNSIAVKIYYDMSILGAEEAHAISSEFTQAVSRLIRSPFASLLLETANELRMRPEVTDCRFQDIEGEIDVGLDRSEWSPFELSIRECLVTLTESTSSEISKTTSFFRLGIDSISSIQLASMLRDQGHTVSSADVMENPTCQKLAHKLLASPALPSRPIQAYDFDGFRKSCRQQITRIVPSSFHIEDVLPCTPLQCAMATSSTADHDTYINLVGFKIAAGISSSRVHAAWQQVQYQHPMLRTALIPVDCKATPFAMVRYSAESSEVPWQEVERCNSIETLGSELKARVGETLHKAPHLPPWRVITASVDAVQYMYLVIHHALYDAVSLQIILNDLASALKGEPVTGSPNPLQGLSEVLADAPSFTEESETFWKSLVPQAVINRFPVLTPLREREDQRGAATIYSRLSFPSILEGCKTRDVTVQSLIESAWTRLLAAYTGEDSVVFGVTLSARDTDATRHTGIPCLTTLPVIARNLESDSELLRSMVDHDSKLAAFRRSSLGDVQRWLGHPSSPLFDTLITYQGHLTETVSELPWDILEDIGVVEFPVALEIQPVKDDQLVLSLSFSTGVIPHEHAEIILKQFDATLCGLLAEPSDGDGEVFETNPSLFSVVPAEVHEIPTEIACLHEFVERQSIATPDAPALEFHASAESGPRIWTYAQLNEMGNKVADMLGALRLEGSLVAVHFDKCPEAYFAILGTLKAGFAFVALDPSMPQARKEFIMRDSKACCLLVSSSWVPDFDAGVPCQRINTDDLSASKASGAEEQAPGPSSSHTCYCLYTSGTTGTPKGCEITHENAVQAMLAFRHLFRGRWDHKSRWLQFAALHFDVSILEQYWTWSVGMTLVVTPRDVILDDLAGTIARLKITHLDLTPSLARLLDPNDVPTLWNGVFITGGEQLRQEILDAWGPKGVIYNAYGPTEATIGVTTHSQVPQNGRPSNIGKPFLNVGTYVLRPGTDSPVLRGAVGELCIAGKLVGKGYINREETTRERFPWLSRFSERVYRTGDLVRLLSDGSFDFLGRADDQVKLRGQRLELGEIDHVIRSALPDLEDLATIVVTQKSPDRSVLVCFLSNGKGKTHQLRPIKGDHSLGRRAKAACRSQLPSYMVPTYFLEVPYIPLSINNKAEHKTLRRAFEDLSPDELVDLTAGNAVSLSREGQTMFDKLQQTLSEFAQSAQLQLLPSSSIFEVGIDSINVLLFVAALRRRGISCTAATALQNPVLADLAEALASLAPDETRSKVREAQQSIKAAFHRNLQKARSVLGCKAEEIEYIAPCTPLQEAMVTTTLTAGRRSPYFVSFDLRLSTTADTRTLHDAWSNIIQNHAILRTGFLQTPEGCIQVASRGVTIDWVVRTTEADRQARKDTWMVSNGQYILRPIQFTLLDTSQGRRLCVDIFHGVYDGTSLEYMLKQVRDIYEDIPTSHGAPSFVESMSYGPIWSFDHCKDFWVDHLQNWSPSKLVALRGGLRNDSEAIVVNKNLHHELFKSALKLFNTTHQSLLLALWTSALCLGFSTIPTIGVVIGGRSLDLEGVEETVGPLFNTLPFYAGSCEGRTWQELATHCHQFSTSVLNFQHVPLRKIQKWCSAGQPLIDSLLTVQPESHLDDSQHLWAIEDATVGAGNLDYPLALEATVQQSGDVQLHLVADSGLATEEAINQLLQHMENSLSAALQDPGIRWTQQSVDLREPAALSVDLSNPVNSNITPEFAWSSTATIIRETLSKLANIHIDSIGAHTSILELGLDSIDVLRLSSKLRDEGVELAPSTIMRCRTIAALIPAVPDGNSSRNANEQSPDMAGLQLTLRSALSRSDRDLSSIEEVLPTTPLQEGMIMAMLDSDFHQYFNHEVFQLDSGVDLVKLQAAWDRLVELNPVLRSGFAEVTDQTLDMAYCQVVHAFRPLHISQQEITAISDSLPQFDLARTLARQSGGWHDMFQVRFASSGSDRFMIVSIAHALYDGWSLGLLYKDLRLAYRGSPVSRPSPRDYLSRHMNRQYDDARSFWEDYLHSAEPTIICSDESSTTQPTEILHSEATSQVKMSEIAEFCKSQGVSFQVICYACWAVILASRSGQLDISFGAVLSGRDFDGAEELMFPTMNTVVQRCILSGSCTSFLSYLEESLRNIRPRQSYPLRKALGAATGGQALFDTIFMVQKNIDADDTTQQPLFKPITGTSETEYPLCAESEVNGDRLIWRIASRSTRFKLDDIKQLFSELDTALKYLLVSAERTILDMHGDKVSICGLAPIVLHDAEAVKSSSRIDNANEGEHEWSPLSCAIAEVLSSVSHVPVSDIKIWNSIYHLGLDSITTIKVSSLLRQKGITLRPRDLLKASDIAEMASIVENSPAAPASTAENLDVSSWQPPASMDIPGLLSSLGLSESHVEALLPASPMQVYMMRSWYTNGGAIFFPTFRIRLPFGAVPARVQEAWRTLLDEIPLLRTCFCFTDSDEIPLVQAVIKSDSTTDVAGWSSCWTETGDDGSLILVLKIHHALYDAFSLAFILKRLSTLCLEPVSKSAPLPLSPWLNYTVQPTLQEQQASRQKFWTEYLGNATAGVQETSMVLPNVSSIRTSHVDANTQCRSAALRRAAAQAGTSVQALFLAAYAKSISVLSHGAAYDGSLVLGIYFANRDKADALPPGYPTLCIIPIKVKVNSSSNLMPSAQAIQRDLNTIGSQGMTDVGLWEIERWTGVTIDKVVNFIAKETENGSDPELQWLPAREDEQEPKGTVTPSMFGDWNSHLLTQAYPATIEVEASLDEEILTVGIFGPQALVSQQAACDMVDGICSTLMAGLP